MNNFIMGLNPNSPFLHQLASMQPQQQPQGLLGSVYNPPQSNFEQMAAPYAQWAAQQLAAVTPQAAQPQPAQQTQQAVPWMTNNNPFNF